MAVTAKEAFWMEHKDSLVRIRSQLNTHGKATPPHHGKSTTPYRRTPQSQAGGRKTYPMASHPPYGKYRRTPSPYLLKVDDAVDRGPHTPPLRGNKYEVVPPVKPRQAFARPKPDYDSWGEESDDEGDDYANEDDDEDRGRRSKYKPKPYPQPSPMMMGAPFAMYYPPPPKGNKRRNRKTPGPRGYKDIHRDRQTHQSMTVSKNRKNKQKGQRGAQSVPVFMPMPMMPMMMPMDNKYKYIYGEDESSDEEMEPILYLNRHPMFAHDLVEDLIKDILEEEILPDTLMEALDEYDLWPYDHPAYLPTLYSSEDVMDAGLRDQLEDVVHEVLNEMTADYMDEKRLQKDPLEDFLTTVVNDAVDFHVRDIVRESVLEMADKYMVDETASNIYNDVFQEELRDMIPALIDDMMFDVVAEDFIAKEVIAPEVEEEARAVATEILQHYDNKITRRELKEVTRKANGQLADSLLMEYIMQVLSRQGKLFTQDDFANRTLDDMILNIAMEEYFAVQKDKDKTVHNKPLKKLHEKAFTEVALDACLQQLTASLDEDLADVDEFERGISAEAGHPISLYYS